MSDEKEEKRLRLAEYRRRYLERHPEVKKRAAEYARKYRLLHYELVKSRQREYSRRRYYRMKERLSAAKPVKISEPE